MIEKLKQYPLIGIALALAGGLVLAHLINKTGDILYENDMLGTVLAWTGAAAVVVVIVLWTRGKWSWLRRINKPLAFTALAVLWLGIFGLLAKIASDERKEKSERTVVYQEQLRQQLVADAEQERQRQAAKAEEDRRFQKLLADTAAKQRRDRQRAGLPPN